LLFVVVRVKTKNKQTSILAYLSVARILHAVIQQHNISYKVSSRQKQKREQQRTTVQQTYLRNAYAWSNHIYYIIYILIIFVLPRSFSKKQKQKQKQIKQPTTVQYY
jgi:hypothetical protein